MLEMQNMSSYYGNSPVLQGVSFRAGKGEFIAVLGRNGVGKTTLLKTIMGLTDRVTGRIFLNRLEITKAPTHERSRHSIGYVPQGRGIIPRFTVRENILMAVLRDRTANANFQNWRSNCFRFCAIFLTVWVACCRADNSSSSPLPERWRPTRALSCSMSQRRYSAEHRRADRAGDRPTAPGAWLNNHSRGAER